MVHKGKDVRLDEKDRLVAMKEGGKRLIYIPM